MVDSNNGVATFIILKSNDIKVIYYLYTYTVSQSEQRTYTHMIGAYFRRDWSQGRVI